MLRLWAIFSRSRREYGLRSAPFGRYCCTRPLVFSLVGRCHQEAIKAGSVVHFITAVYTRRRARRGRLGLPPQRLPGHPALYRDETKTRLKSQPQIWDIGAGGEQSSPAALTALDAYRVERVSFQCQRAGDKPRLHRRLTSAADGSGHTRLE